AALVGEAQRVIASGKAEELRLGAGSPLIDIRLPCGSGIDLLIMPDPDAKALHRVRTRLSAREPVELVLNRDGMVIAREAEADEHTGWQGDGFRLRINPQLRLVIAGHGEEVTALHALARAWGTETWVLTPDERLAAELGSTAVLLKTPAAIPALNLDRWSALVMLFHDHDWEVPLLAKALEQHAFYLGAMGSPATHQRRLEALAQIGVPSDTAALIRGPIGLIPAARDPQTLALSVLAEVVATYNAG
ncbi:MAG: XdhC family protein, partial [Novosphingobium sp.]